jgi:hypothetical protein
LEPLTDHRGIEISDTSKVAAGTVKVATNPAATGSAPVEKTIGTVLVEAYPALEQIGDLRRDLILLVLCRPCRAIFESMVPALDKTAFRQAVPQFPEIRERVQAENTYDGQFRLRPCCERPPSRSTSNKTEKLSPPHIAPGSANASYRRNLTTARGTRDFCCPACHSRRLKRVKLRSPDA